MSLKSKNRGIPVEQATQRDILRKQMELLAKASFNDPIGLPAYSKQMVAIHRELLKPIWAVVFGGVVLLCFLVHSHVLAKKLRRG